MWSGTLTLEVDSVTVMRGSLHGRGREFALVSWLLRNVSDHRVNQVTLSHLPKGRFSYPRRAFSASGCVRGAGAGARRPRLPSGGHAELARQAIDMGLDGARPGRAARQPDGLSRRNAAVDAEAAAAAGVVSGGYMTATIRAYRWTGPRRAKPCGAPKNA